MLPRIVVVGAGHLGTYHLEKMAAYPGATLAGVVDTDPAHLQRAAKRFAIPGESSLQAFAGKADGAIVATPTTTHLRLGAEALALGMHVLVEKPIAANGRDGATLVALAKKAKRILQVGHVERFNPAIAAALEVADRPHYIVAERLGQFSGRSTDVDVVLDLMIHDLDIVGSLVTADVVEIWAIGVPVMTQEVDMASARLSFEDGTVAQLSAGRASLEPSRKLRLFTEQRYVSIDCAKREVKSVRRLPPDPSSPWPQITGELLDVPDGDALALQDAHFVECIATVQIPRVDGQAGLRALMLAEAIKEVMTVPRGAANPAGLNSEPESEPAEL